MSTTIWYVQYVCQNLIGCGMSRMIRTWPDCEEGDDDEDGGQCQVRGQPGPAHPGPGRDWGQQQRGQTHGRSGVQNKLLTDLSPPFFCLGYTSSTATSDRVLVLLLLLSSAMLLRRIVLSSESISMHDTRNSSLDSRSKEGRGGGEVNSTRVC